MRTRNRKSRITATGDYKKILKKQKYALVGENCCVQLCGWAKKSILNQGYCYKEKFYGIKSHQCCQMSPWMKCQNKCIHCWRPIELEIKTDNKTENPKELVEKCVIAQRKLLTGFGGYEKTDQKKFKEAQNPSQFAISLIGEPTCYPKLAEFILELRNQGKTSFVVTNGLLPEKIKELEDKNALPTQLYISLLYPDEKMFRKLTGNDNENSWKNYNETLKLMKSLKTRTVVRMTLIKGINDNEKYLESYANLIQKASPLFIEVKSYMAVGFSKNRKGMGLKRMLFHKEIKEFSDNLLKFLPGYKFLDEKAESRVVLLGKDKERMKIKDMEI